MKKAQQVVQIYGSDDSPEAYQLRDFVSRSTAHFEWIPVRTDEDSMKYLNLPKLNNIRMPVVRLPSGECLYEPSLRELADKLGLVTRPRLRNYDVAIYGAGPAGLSAAVYAASEGLSTVLIEKHSIGGQAGSSSMIENYLGFPEGVSGTELAEYSRQQAIKFGAEILLLNEGVKTYINDLGNLRVSLSDGSCMGAKTSIFATGVQWRKLNLPSEKRFLGRGIYYGAGISEAPLCAGKTVAVVGGGNSAGQAVMHMSQYADKVWMLVRGKSLSENLSQYLVDKILANPKVQVQYCTEVQDVEGTFRVEGIHVRDKFTKTEECIPSECLFICIGGEPSTGFLSDTGIMLDPAGYILTGNELFATDDAPWNLARPPMHLETCLPGTFAVGDVRSGSIKRVATAVGEGATAVSLIHKYLAERG